MARFFDEHQKRQVQSLNGTWEFVTDPDDIGEIQGWAMRLPHSCKVMVPSLWNNEMGLLEYEGAAWYQKKFYTNPFYLK